MGITSAGDTNKPAVGVLVGLVVVVHSSGGSVEVDDITSIRDGVDNEDAGTIWASSEVVDEATPEGRSFLFIGLSISVVSAPTKSDSSNT